MSRSNEFWYLASPYSKYPEGPQRAFEIISKEAGALMEEGINVFCPIAMGHPISTYSGLDIKKYEIWLPQDKSIFQHAKGMIVCKMESWETSHGVQWEIKEFTAEGKPIYYFSPGQAAGLVQQINEDEYMEAVVGTEAY